MAAAAAEDAAAGDAVAAAVGGAGMDACAWVVGAVHAVRVVRAAHAVESRDDVVTAAGAGAGTKVARRKEKRMNLIERRKVCALGRRLCQWVRRSQVVRPGVVAAAACPRCCCRCCCCHRHHRRRYHQHLNWSSCCFHSRYHSMYYHREGESWEVLYPMYCESYQVVLP